AVRRCDLRGQHEAMLVEKCARIRFRVEIAAFPAPIGPGACETVKDLPGVALGAKARVSGQGRERFMVRLMTPQEGRNTFFRHSLQNGRDTGLAEIFLGEHVTGHLAPLGGNLNVLQMEDHRPVRVADLTRRRPEFDAFVRRLTLDSEATLDTHLTPGFPLVNARPRPGREGHPACYRGAEVRCAKSLWNSGLRP